MIGELDTVVLTRDVPEHGLMEGDAVVHRYPDGSLFEVEFVTAEGHTVTVLRLGPEELRPIAGDEILHARRLGLARTAPTDNVAMSSGLTPRRRAIAPRVS